MDCLTFIAELVDSIAWPTTIFAITYLFKKELSKLALKLKKFKYKDTELEFENGLEKIVDATVQEGIEITPPKENAIFKNDYDLLIRISETSSRAAVLEAFRILESTISEVLRLNKIHSINSRKAYELLLEKGLLNQESLELLNGLRELRNKAAHDDDFKVRKLFVKDYIEIALSLASEIKENHKPKF